MTAKPNAIDTVLESITSIWQRSPSAAAAWRAVSMVPEKPEDTWIETIRSVCSASRS